VNLVLVVVLLALVTQSSRERSMVLHYFPHDFIATQICLATWAHSCQIPNAGLLFVLVLLVCVRGVCPKRRDECRLVQGLFLSPLSHSLWTSLHTFQDWFWPKSQLLPKIPILFSPPDPEFLSLLTLLDYVALINALFPI